MNIVMNLVLVAQILSAMAMIGLILMQHGKGADMGAAFGSGASGSLFGASGSANFLSRATAILATVFLACTLALSYFGSGLGAARSGGSSVLDQPAAAVPASAAASAAAPVAAASGAAAIPSDTVAPAQAASAAVPAASGAAQIPR
ncbi:MAG: preprotein translocase subunit SecG [Burkholderiaceae bacterium]|jgi:preprotein translocase subunit SecG|nr:preprotein translocase subunit SecG [Burkholderiaceae bacterium]